MIPTTAQQNLGVLFDVDATLTCDRIHDTSWAVALRALCSTFDEADIQKILGRGIGKPEPKAVEAFVSEACSIAPGVTFCSSSLTAQRVAYLKEQSLHELALPHTKELLGLIHNRSHAIGSALCTSSCGSYIAELRRQVEGKIKLPVPEVVADDAELLLIDEPQRWKPNSKPWQLAAQRAGLNAQHDTIITIDDSPKNIVSALRDPMLGRNWLGLIVTNNNPHKEELAKQACANLDSELAGRIRVIPDLSFVAERIERGTKQNPFSIYP